MEEVISAYLMNPAEDEIRPAHEITEGMWVLSELPAGRAPDLYGQRFCQVTKLRKVRDASFHGGEGIEFIGEWVDGYQRSMGSYSEFPWLVKRSNENERKETK